MERFLHDQTTTDRRPSDDSPALAIAGFGLLAVAAFVAFGVCVAW